MYFTHSGQGKPDKVISEQRPGARTMTSMEQSSKQREQKCKGTKVSICLKFLRNSKEIHPVWL